MPLISWLRFAKKFPHEAEVLERIGKHEFDRWMEFYRENNLQLLYNFPNSGKDLTADEITILGEVLELAYKSNVYRLDVKVGQLVRWLREFDLDETMVVFTADHGETMNVMSSPFRWSHGHTLHSSVLDVPLIIHKPGQRTTAVVETVSRSIDVFPTVAAMLEFELPTQLDGRDATDGTERIAFSHTGTLPQGSNGFAHRDLLYPDSSIELTWVGLRSGDLTVKYQNLDGHGFQWYAYNLERDPDEASNIFDPDDERHNEFARALSSYRADLIDASSAVRSAELEKSESLKRLRALGYVD